uniref:Late transcription factor VLTF3 like protein n=1 Tax=Virus NIOZ-UU159 TaxID=2763270 RepID=A0A7S9XEB1_9VIRU|nr:MAG: late transcription factor VLTF3 like protein [Virus NIOZ-UU159]|tara:strand:- start:428 stop:1774 length:1347 start_codon:yes stop_codon:yes gene_type:complete
MFKEKSSKKKINTDTNETYTLDAMHNNMIKNFENTDKELSYYNNLLNKYELSSNIIFNELNKETNKDTINILWSSNIDLREKIIDTKNKIKELNNNYDEIEYYKNTSYILFQYYDTVDKQSHINNALIGNNNIIKSSVDLPIKQSRNVYKSESKKKKAILLHNTINVLDALNNINNNTNCEDNNTSTSNIENNDITSKNTKNEETFEDKSTLVDKYMSIINKKYVRNVEDDNIEICKECKSKMICLQQDAIMICNTCGYQELLLVEQNRPILKQNTKDTSHFCYKRINHFREWCNQVQGKESTDIPDEVFVKILAEIKKEKIVDLKTITYTKMRDILKRLRINKYYEHINYIINRINGIPTPQFSPELEEKLCSMFRSIQAPFLKHCPKDRKNFLSYSYVLYKFFQILGLDEYLKYFPLLKSREKLYVQDQIWKKICIDLNYENIPSL